MFSHSFIDIEDVIKMKFFLFPSEREIKIGRAEERWKEGWKNWDGKLQFS